MHWHIALGSDRLLFVALAADKAPSTNADADQQQHADDDADDDRDDRDLVRSGGGGGGRQHTDRG